MTASRANDEVGLRGLDLIVDEEDQIRKPGVPFALDTDLLLEVLQGLVVASSQEVLEG
jgi:hypothetical protein